MGSRAHSVTVIAGDGIGPEVAGAVRRIIEAAGVAIKWREMDAGAAAIEMHGSAVPEEVLEAIRRDGVALKGPVTTPIGGGFTSANVTLRKKLDLYACLRPVRTLPGVQSRYGDLDLVVVRENTEGLYSGIEHEVVPGVVESLKIVTESACTRISRFAFGYARRCGRRRVTAVHKANIMKLTDGLFLRCARKIAKDYPEIEYDEAIIDALCMKLVQKPEQFDLLLCDNLYGDIISDLTAGLVGGLGLVPGANLGETCAVFEAVHGSAPDIAGRDLANPTALLLSGCLMLDHLDETAAADRIRTALMSVLQRGQCRTGDIGGSASTTEFTQCLIDQLQGTAA